MFAKLFVMNAISLYCLIVVDYLFHFGYNPLKVVILFIF